MSPNPRAEDTLRLSDLLRSLAESSADRVSLADVAAHFGRRAFGAALFFFALLNLLPLPPGSTTVLGLPLLVMAAQLAIGARTPWLPRFMARWSMRRSLIDRVCRRAAPWVTRVERLTRRRATFVFGPIGDRLIGAVCTLLALVIVLPIPLGNVLPCATVAVLSLGLVHRDGAVAILGYGLAIASAAVLGFTAELVWIVVARLADALA